MNSYLIQCSDLIPAQKRAMFGLLNTHFEGVTEAVFERDLAEKNWAVLVEDDDRRLQGFTTINYHRTSYRNRTIGVVCSGDTIVGPSARASSALPIAWLQSVLWLGRDLDSDCLYWLLISSGYRTYRFLPTFFRDYYPARDGATDSDLETLAKCLAGRRWADQYDPLTGLVRFAEPQQLKPWVSPLNPKLQQDRHIAYFVRRNPGHDAGDELVCLTRISAGNLTAAGRRLLRAANNLPRREQAVPG
jgi:hypothetical protein